MSRCLHPKPHAPHRILSGRKAVQCPGVPHAPVTAEEQQAEAITNVLVDPGGAVAELNRLREALEVVEDENGEVDVLALADELRDLRIEVSYLRSEHMRVRDQRHTALVLHWPGVNGVCTGCGAASPCPTVEALGGGGQP